MSKVGKKPITIPAGVTVSLAGLVVEVTGPLGKVSQTLPDSLSLAISDNQLTVSRLNETKTARSCHGTYTRLLANMLVGVSQGFSKTLEIVGTGFKAEMVANALVLSLGYSHQINYPVPTNVKIEVVEGKIIITGVDCQVVGQIAHTIKSFRQPDSYKGKGIRYLGQKLKLKPGKAAAKGATK